jgi:glucokinase
MSDPSEDGHWLGFDLGGTKMQASLFTSKFQLLTQRRKKTRGHEGPTAGIDRIKGMIEKCLEEAALPRDQLAGIGIGCPGPLDLNEGIIREAPNLGWKNVPLREILEKEFGCPVVLCNDVDAGVYGEFRFGSAVGARTVLGVFPGTGIGGGMVTEGKIFRGATTSCLEIGHFPTVPNGGICGCGRRGCLETVASRLAISAEVAKAAYRGQAPHIMRLAGTDLANIRSGTLAEAIEHGDTIVDRIVRDAARHLGVAMAGAVNLLAPDLIVLGGGLVEALPKVFIGEVQGALNDHTLPSLKGSFELRSAKLGDEATSMGAAAWCRQAGKHHNKKGTEVGSAV